MITSVAKLIGHFPFEQKFRFAFREICSGEWNSIVRNYQKRGQTRKAYLNYRKFLKFPFCLISLLGIPEWLAFRKFKNFLIFRKLFQEISVPFAPVSKFLEFLVEWKAPYMKCPKPWTKRFMQSNVTTICKTIYKTILLSIHALPTTVSLIF